MDEESVTITVLFCEDIVMQHNNKPFRLSELEKASGQDVVFTPNDPQSNEAELRRYYSTEALNSSNAKRLLDRLLSLPCVIAAWTRPVDAVPN